VWEIITRSEGRQELKATYLWKTAYSVVLDEVRRARWRYERTFEDDADERATMAADPEQNAAAVEVAKKVRDCLAGLDEGRRRAVQLRLAGVGHETASRMLGLSVKQISNLAFRGMQDLRACLRAKGIRA
jgi:RNA polymerase sigma factor (sigma-70 family)